MAYEGMSPIEAALTAVSEIQISLMSAEHPSSENLTRGLDASNALYGYLNAQRTLESFAAGKSNILLRVLGEAEPVLDELIAWINTDNIGCLEVEARGEEMRKTVRDIVERARGN